MKSILILALSLFVITAEAAVAELRYSPEFIFSKVLELMNKQPQEIPLPEIRFASKTNLKDFQDDMEKYWNFRPEKITNAYAPETNRIYLTDDAGYYEKTGRCMDDSLAHEYVHYVQVHYMKIPIGEFDDSMEWQAIDVQTRFREENCK